MDTSSSGFILTSFAKEISSRRTRWKSPCEHTPVTHWLRAIPVTVFETPEDPEKTRRWRPHGLHPPPSSTRAQKTQGTATKRSEKSVNPRGPALGVHAGRGLPACGECRETEPAAAQLGALEAEHPPQEEWPHAPGASPSDPVGTGVLQHATGLRKPQHTGSLSRWGRTVKQKRLSEGAPTRK